jgi:hypothetical protein
VFDAITRTPGRDADGMGAGAAVMLAQLAGSRGWSGAEITVIA